MANQNFDIQAYMTKGVENIVKGALKATLTNPKESLFMLEYAKASKKASKIRAEYNAKGENIPPFLIASITSNCNLHCAGCYSRANKACSDEAPVSQLSAEDWKKVFVQARELGIGFILLAGGEPMLRKDVIEVAGEFPDILFPIFTNGTMMNEKYVEIFAKYRNLIPVISVEGHRQKTDDRRGQGVYEKITRAINLMNESKVIYGTSITLTTENLMEVTSDEYINSLEEQEARVVFYVEYVPVTEESLALAPTDETRAYMDKRLAEIREQHPNVLFVSFPGDEKSSGGCLAAGRGFFHINSHGGAEPCPFSPYSDINIKDATLLEALHSELFTKLRDSGALNESHEGGCVLFEKKDFVESLI